MMQAFVEKGGEPTAAHLIRRLLTMDTRQKALDEVLEEREDLVGKIPFGHDACYEDGKHIFSIEPVPEEVKLPKGLNGKFNTTGKPFLADDLPLPEQDKEAIRDAFYDCGFGKIVNMATHYYIEGITLCNVKTVDCDKSAFVDAVKKYQSSLMAEGMDLTTANEHIMDAFREANTAQINYAK